MNKATRGVPGLGGREHGRDAHLATRTSFEGKAFHARRRRRSREAAAAKRRRRRRWRAAAPAKSQRLRLPPRCSTPMKVPHKWKSNVERAVKRKLRHSMLHENSSGRAHPEGSAAEEAAHRRLRRLQKAEGKHQPLAGAKRSSAVLQEGARTVEVLKVRRGSSVGKKRSSPGVYGRARFPSSCQRSAGKSSG